MTIQNIKELDLYTCSLSDIIDAKNFMQKYCLTLIKNGESTLYKEASRLHTLTVRAYEGKDSKGYMMQSGTRPTRLSNEKSVL